MNANERALSLAITRNAPDHGMGTEVTEKVAELVNIQVEMSVQKGTYKLVKTLLPIVEISASFTMPNMGTTSLYSGCEINSVMIRM